MNAVQIINARIPTLDLADDVQKALVFMEQNRCDCLPVTDNNRLVGFALKESLAKADDKNKKMKECDLVGLTCVANRTHHFYDVLKIADHHRMKMVAVLDDKQHYQGVINVQDVMAPFGQSDDRLMPGGILVLSLSMRDYSLAEISRLVEENGAKILSSSVAEDGMDNKKMRVILKINQLSLDYIVATFERFGYNIIGRYQEHSKYHREYAERVDSLLHYLDI